MAGWGYFKPELVWRACSLAQIVHTMVMYVVSCDNMYVHTIARGQANNIAYIIIIHMYFSILLIHWQQHPTSQSIIPSSSHHHEARYHFLLHVHLCSCICKRRTKNSPFKTATTTLPELGVRLRSTIKISPT